MLLRERLSELEFYGDFVNKKKLIRNNDFFFFSVKKDCYLRYVRIG